MIGTQVKQVAANVIVRGLLLLEFQGPFVVMWAGNGEQRRGGELHLGDLAAAFTCMGIMLAYQNILVICFVEVHTDLGGFMGQPIEIGVPPKLTTFKKKYYKMM